MSQNHNPTMQSYKTYLERAKEYTLLRGHSITRDEAIARTGISRRSAIQIDLRAEMRRITADRLRAAGKAEGRPDGAKT